MKTILTGLGLAGLLLALPGRSSAQVSLGFGIDIAFPEPPPLVVVSPGIRVVPEFDEEVYFVNDWYWVRRDDSWYRTRDYHGGWRPVRPARVPVGLVRIPPGRYRHYYRDDDGRWRPHDPDAYRAWRDQHSMDERRGWWREHHRDRMVRMEQERSWREHQREDRDAQRAELRRRQEERENMRHEHDREMRERRHQDRGGGAGGPGSGHHDDRGSPPPGHDKDRPHH